MHIFTEDLTPSDKHKVDKPDPSMARQLLVVIIKCDQVWYLGIIVGLAPYYVLSTGIIIGHLILQESSDIADIIAIMIILININVMIVFYSRVISISLV